MPDCSESVMLLLVLSVFIVCVFIHACAMLFVLFACVFVRACVYAYVPVCMHIVHLHE